MTENKEHKELEKKLEKSKEDYIYNKSIVGGIDPNKADYNQTFSEKIYLYKKPKTSWIVFGVLCLFFIGFGVYIYAQGINILDIIPKRQPAENTEIVEQVENIPEVNQNVTTVKTRLLEEVPLPEDIYGDNTYRIINNIKFSSGNIGSIIGVISPIQKNILYSEMDLLLTIIQSNNNQENESQTTTQTQEPPVNTTETQTNTQEIPDNQQNNPGPIAP